jgi:hypothetical protein
MSFSDENSPGKVMVAYHWINDWGISYVMYGKPYNKINKAIQ